MKILIGTVCGLAIAMVFTKLRSSGGPSSEHTIKNVHAAMSDAGISAEQATKAVYNMQQLGIRFHEET